MIVYPLRPAWPSDLLSLACPGRDSPWFEGPEEPHGLLLCRRQLHLHPHCLYADPQQGRPLHRMAFGSHREHHHVGRHTGSENFSNSCFICRKKSSKAWKSCATWRCFILQCSTRCSCWSCSCSPSTKTSSTLTGPLGSKRISQSRRPMRFETVSRRHAWLHEGWIF